MKQEIRHFHMFCGLGGSAMGFNRGHARVGTTHATFRCLGGVDINRGALRDFTRLTGVDATCLDLFDRDQYEAFHGHAPPRDWREATPQDMQAAAGGERPHIVFLSAPCKGFSSLLSTSTSQLDKYQALNALTLRGIWLMVEAWRDDPPELIVFENVPRIRVRGRHLLDQIGSLLRHAGYAVAETAHDCGEIGHLAQTRRRFLLVARHLEKVPPFLYEPEKHPLRGVGDVIGQLPQPGISTTLPMHRLPALQWRTWVRLAYVETGSDWRSLNRLNVKDGHLTHYTIAPDTHWHRGVLGVLDWSQPSPTLSARSGPTNGRYAVADPRNFPIVEPKPDIAAYSIEDIQAGHRDAFQWGLPSNTASDAHQRDNDWSNFAHPRDPHQPNENLVCRIKALDGTWHRPFTTLELAALQGLMDAQSAIELDGLSDAAWRERIGNAVPPPAAEAIANAMAKTLLLAWTGEQYRLSHEPIWVRTMLAGLSVRTADDRTTR